MFSYLFVIQNKTLKIVHAIKHVGPRKIQLNKTKRTNTNLSTKCCVGIKSEKEKETNNFFF